MTDFSNEQWRPVPGYEGLYSISSMGRVRSEKRYIVDSRTGARYMIPEKMLKLSDRNGYKSFRVSKKSKTKGLSVHRTLLRAFVGEPAPGMEARHLNSNPSDNRLENLKFGTKSENMQDAVKIGTLVFSRSKLSRADVINIAHDPRRISDIARAYHTNTTTVISIKTGKSFKGFTRGIVHNARIKESLSDEVFNLVMNRAIKRSEIMKQTGLTLQQVKRIRKTGQRVICRQVLRGDISAV